MKLLSIEKFRILAQKTGWSLEYSEGYVDGEVFRKRGKPPSQLALIGVDQYSSGFRAGYFERQGTSSAGGARPDAVESSSACGEKPDAVEMSPALSDQRLHF